MEADMQKKEQGKFIVIDGPDGAGKSTVIKGVHDALVVEGIPLIVTREPGGSPYAEEIREVILSDTAADADPLTMLYLFSAARIERLRRTVEPALAAGTHVLSDRFDSTTFAYQVVAEERRTMGALFGILRQQYAQTLPFYILLDVSPEVGRSRMGNRAKLDHFEERSPQWHERARGGFKDFVYGFCKQGQFEVVNAEQSPEVVLQEVLDIVRRVVS
jgi:dTMP kinase